MRVQVALSCISSMPKGLEIILHYHQQYLALKTQMHISSKIWKHEKNVSVLHRFLSN